MTVKRKNKTVPDPDLEIRGGGQSSRPLGKGGGGGGGRSPEKFFLALRASVWSKTKRGPIKIQYDDTLFFVYKNVVFSAQAECS